MIRHRPKKRACAKMRNPTYFFLTVFLMMMISLTIASSDEKIEIKFLEREMEEAVLTFHKDTEKWDYYDPGLEQGRKESGKREERNNMKLLYQKEMGVILLHPAEDTYGSDVGEIINLVRGSDEDREITMTGIAILQPDDGFTFNYKVVYPTDTYIPAQLKYDINQQTWTAYATESTSQDDFLFKYFVEYHDTQKLQPNFPKLIQYLQIQKVPNLLIGAAINALKLHAEEKFQSDDYPWPLVREYFQRTNKNVPFYVQARGNINDHMHNQIMNGSFWKINCFAFDLDGYFNVILHDEDENSNILNVQFSQFEYLLKVDENIYKEHLFEDKCKVALNSASEKLEDAECIFAVDAIFEDFKKNCSDEHANKYAADEFSAFKTTMLNKKAEMCKVELESASRQLQAAKHIIDVNVIFEDFQKKCYEFRREFSVFETAIIKKKEGICKVELERAKRRVQDAENIIGVYAIFEDFKKMCYASSTFDELSAFKTTMLKKKEEMYKVELESARRKLQDAKHIIGVNAIFEDFKNMCNEFSAFDELSAFEIAMIKKKGEIEAANKVSDILDAEKNAQHKTVTNETREKSDIRSINWGGVALFFIIIGLQNLLISYLHFSKNIFCVLLSHYKFKEEIEEEPDFSIEIVSGDEMNEVSIKNGGDINETEFADEHISDFNVVSADECIDSNEYTTENEDSDDITDSEEIKLSEHANMKEEQEDEEMSEDTDEEEEEEEGEEQDKDEQEEETSEDTDEEKAEEKFRHRHIDQW